jgi:chemotaxis protein methyltransferase CheR
MHTPEQSASAPADALNRLGPRDFQRLATFIEGYSGIKMPPTKVTMVEGRLRKRVRATGMVNLKRYCDYLFLEGGLEAEAVHLIDAVTTNKTEFFREPDHFRFLAERVVPRMISLQKGMQSRSELKIWSAACSTGAEPYTLAIVLAELAEQTDGLRCKITATDICTEVVETAILGIYPAAMIDPVPPQLRRRYIAYSKDHSRNQVRIVPELRAMVHWGRVNLIQAPYPIDRDMDVIFCRNILIYFDKPTQETVLRRLCEHLRRGGYLFLGHSETITGLELPLEPVGSTVFRRI